jgi:uncharacterized protein YdiU (UPF0061 family)
MNENFSANKLYNNKDFLIWKKRWLDRLKLNNNTQEKYLKLMRSANPLVIARNHKVEEALEAANNNDITKMNNLIKILEKPYNNQKNIDEFQIPNPNENENYQTFCGT